MEVAPGDSLSSPLIELCGEVATICAEWARTVGLKPGAESALRVDLPSHGGQVGVHSDVHHLRRVLVNLLDNAHRHGGGGAAATCVKLGEAEGPCGAERAQRRAPDRP